VCEKGGGSDRYDAHRCYNDLISIKRSLNEVRKVKVGVGCFVMSCLVLLFLPQRCVCGVSCHA